MFTRGGVVFLAFAFMSTLSRSFAEERGSKGACGATLEREANETHPETFEHENKPTNQPANRHKGFPDVRSTKAELPPIFADAATLTRHGIVVGKKGKLKIGPNKKFQAIFNPAAFVAKGKDGKDKVYMVIRGEEDRPQNKWPRRSLPYLLESSDGINFELVKDQPLFEADAWYDEIGGIEDPRYADLSLQNYVDTKTGKSYDSAMMYTGYDGEVARVCVAYFNKSDLASGKKIEFLKKGPLFPDADVQKNPLISKPDETGKMKGTAWNKSPAMIQYKDKTGKVRNVLYVGEGGHINNGDGTYHAHGGIMALESDSPFAFKWPKNKGPVIRAQMHTPYQNLVESAYQPIITKLPEHIAKQTGESHGIVLSLHGDSPPRGYQVGYRVFSLDDPNGEPIYSGGDQMYLWPQEDYEINGQVGKVVFASGAVKFNGRWIIYYGTADSYVGAVSAPAREESGPVF